MLSHELFFFLVMLFCVGSLLSGQDFAQNKVVFSFQLYTVKKIKNKGWGGGNKCLLKMKEGIILVFPASLSERSSTVFNLHLTTAKCAD